MKKTVTVNLNGRAFTIDEDAYELLNNYLENLRVYFRKEEDSSEILADFEARIEELLGQKLCNGIQVINKQNIEEVISLMGNPDDFGGENFSAEETQRIYEEPKTEPKKKFFRDMDDKMLGGVCSGIAAYFGWESLPVRIIFIIVLFLTKFWLALVYFALWLVVPIAKTAEEKLQMRGEPITVENIGKTVAAETENIKKNGTGYLNGIVNFFASIFKVFLVGIGSLIGFCLIIAVLVSILVFFSTIFGVGGGILTNFFHVDYWGMPSSLFSISLFLIFIIPLGGLIYSLIAHLAKLKPMNKGIKWGLIIAWILIIVLLLIAVFKVNVVRGNGIQASKTYSFPIINSIDFGGKMPSDITIEQIEGEETKLSIQTDANLLDLIDVQSGNNGHLILTTKGDNRISYNEDIKLVIQTPTLNRIETSGAKNVEFKGKFISENLTVNILGIGNVETDSLYVKNLTLRNEGTGNFEVKGKAGKVYLEINGTGNIDANKLDADSIYASINGLGQIECNPQLYIDAQINGIGDISYKHNPINGSRPRIAGIGVIGSEKSFKE